MSLPVFHYSRHRPRQQYRGSRPRSKSAAGVCCVAALSDTTAPWRSIYANLCRSRSGWRIICGGRTGVLDKCRCAGLDRSAADTISTQCKQQTTRQTHPLVVPIFCSNNQKRRARKSSKTKAEKCEIKISNYREKTILVQYQTPLGISELGISLSADNRRTQARNTGEGTPASWSEKEIGLHPQTRSFAGVSLETRKKTCLSS